jgi:hypothetical protein
VWPDSSVICKWRWSGKARRAMARRAAGRRGEADRPAALQGAALQGAALLGAALQGAALLGAALLGAVLQEAVLQEAAGRRETKWPAPAEVRNRAAIPPAGRLPPVRDKVARRAMEIRATEIRAREGLPAQAQMVRAPMVRAPMDKARERAAVGPAAAVLEVVNPAAAQAAGPGLEARHRARRPLRPGQEVLDRPPAAAAPDPFPAGDRAMARARRSSTRKSRRSGRWPSRRKTRRSSSRICLKP